MTLATGIMLRFRRADGSTYCVAADTNCCPTRPNFVIAVPNGAKLEWQRPDGTTYCADVDLTCCA